MDESIVKQMQDLHAMCAGETIADAGVSDHYASVVCKAIGQHMEDMGSVLCRQLLADVLRMNVQRPSSIYTAILAMAIKVAKRYPEFHFITFLNMWGGADTLREEDYQPVRLKDGDVIPPIADRVVRAMLTAQIVRMDEKPAFVPKQWFGYRPVTCMIVTKVTKAEVGRCPVYFAQLVSPDGIEVTAETHSLHTNPLTPSDKRHYVNVGQVYNVVLRDKRDGDGCRLVDGVLALQAMQLQTSQTGFSCISGYVDSIDRQHGHIHIYDGQSRHFVSSGQPFVSAGEGQFVRFVPVIPKRNGFKTAIIVPPSAGENTAASLTAAFPPRRIRITSINTVKQYAAWQLVDASVPIKETLTDYQTSHGETPVSFTSGFMDLGRAKQQVPDIGIGREMDAIIYLRRGVDKQKRPYVACIVS